MRTSHKCTIFYCVLFTCFSFLSCREEGEQTNLQNEEKVEEIVNEFNGQSFVLDGLVDSTGQATQLDFTKSDLTIIDFWFKDCPPCIKEMQQFESLLKDKEKHINIVSISINQFWVWKPLLQHPTGKFDFLAKAVPNWQHLTLQTKDNPRFKNEISVDRAKEIKEKYKVEFFPQYFVVDNKGVILSQPLSAVKFMKEYKY